MYITNNQGLELLKLLTKIKGEGGINRGENICTQRKKMQTNLSPTPPKNKKQDHFICDRVQLDNRRAR